MSRHQKYTVITAGSQAKIKCNIEGQVFEKIIPISFEPNLQENEDVTPVPVILSSRHGIQSYVKIPIINRANHDMKLPPNTIFGSINQFQSVTSIEPANINFEEEKRLLEQQKNEIRQQQPTDNSDINRQSSQNHWVKKIERFINKPMDVDKVNKILRDLDLSNLSQEEQEIVVELITEVTDVFCNDEDDISNVTDCKMKINLKDKTPVQKSYYAMLKPLHEEVKNYLEDLLNKGWKTKSCSSYSSPVVAV